MKTTIIHILILLAVIGCGPTEKPAGVAIVNSDELLPAGPLPSATADATLKLGTTDLSSSCVIADSAMIVKDTLVVAYTAISGTASDSTVRTSKKTVCTLKGTLTIPTNHVLTIEPESPLMDTDATLGLDDYAELNISATHVISGETFGDTFTSQVSGVRAGKGHNILLGSAKSGKPSTVKYMECGNLRKHDVENVAFEIKYDIFVYNAPAANMASATVEYQTAPKFVFKLKRCVN